MRKLFVQLLGVGVPIAMLMLSVPRLTVCRRPLLSAVLSMLSSCQWAFLRIAFVRPSRVVPEYSSFFMRYSGVGFSERSRGHYRSVQSVPSLGSTRASTGSHLSSVVKSNRTNPRIFHR